MKISRRLDEARYVARRSEANQTRYRLSEALGLCLGPLTFQ
jgi:hypothetical protein